MNTSKMNDSQRDYLIQFMETNTKLAKSRMDNAFTKEDCIKMWDKLASSLNSLGGANKTVKQWKRSWTDLKILSKKKAADLKSRMTKTGGGVLTSESDEDTETGNGCVAGPSQNSHERILSIIGKTAVEGIEGVKELGIEDILGSDSEEENVLPPKRPKLREDPTQPSRQVKSRMSKQEHVAQWLELKKKKVEAMENVAGALNNIAAQIGRIADSFEQYNFQPNE